MSATNALTKSVHQTAMPKLSTSTIPGRSRSRLAGKALTLDPRVHVSQTLPNSLPPFSFSVIWHSLGFGICYLLLSPLKCSPKNLKHFRLKLKCLALYQSLTKNLTQKAEMPEMLKCYFGPWAFRHSLVIGAWSLDIYRSPSALKRSLKRFKRFQETLKRSRCKSTTCANLPLKR